MRNVLLNRILLVTSLLVILLFDGCKSHKNIVVTDDSSLTSSRKEFFENLYSSMSFKTQNIDSYYSKKISISADGIPVYNSVNASLYFNKDNYLVSKLYLPFPVVEVFKVMISEGNLKADSKMLNINNVSKPFPAEFNSLLFSAFCGKVPEAYKFLNETDFSKFNLYIEGNKYVLYRKLNASDSIKIIINNDMSISSIIAYNDSYCLTFECSKYTKIDGFDIPMFLNVCLTKDNSVYKAEITVKSASLNGNTKLDY